MRVSVIAGERQVEIVVLGSSRRRLAQVEGAARRILADLADLPEGEPPKPTGFTLIADTDRAPDDDELAGEL